MQPESVAITQFEDAGERIDGADRGSAEGRHHGAYVARSERPLERRTVHAAVSVARNGFEFDAQYGAQALVRVVRLLRRDHLAAGTQLARDPQRLEIRHGAAAAQVAEMRLPAEHAGDGRDRLLLHARARAPAVEGVIVGIDPRGERARGTRHRVRGLQHLSRVERMEIREVVEHALRDFAQHARHRCGVRAVLRRLHRRQGGEALVERAERLFEEAQRILFQRRGHRCLA